MDQSTNQMLNRRLEVDEMLRNIVGQKRLYFQPPASMKMQYPCIRYSRYNIENSFANGKVYKQSHKYEIIVIDEDPDSGIVFEVSKIPGIKHDRHYESNNLNHDVFTLYY